jgi:multidrug efflux pump subunit AcrA (membrane-fusion protein)
VKLLLALVFVIACRSTDDRAARAHQAAVKTRTAREALFVPMERARVSEAVTMTALDNVSEQHAKADAVQAQIEQARAELGTAKSAAESRVVSAKLDELEANRRAIIDEELAITRAVPLERKRIASLPATCFIYLPPADCKIPADIAKRFWTAPDPLAADPAGEPVSRETDARSQSSPAQSSPAQ